MLFIRKPLRTHCLLVLSFNHSWSSQCCRFAFCSLLNFFLPLETELFLTCEMALLFLVFSPNLIVFLAYSLFFFFFSWCSFCFLQLIVTWQWPFSCRHYMHSTGSVLEGFLVLMCYWGHNDTMKGNHSTSVVVIASSAVSCSRKKEEMVCRWI